MKTITIKQKIANTGTIHDLASDWQDRKIRIPDNGYAVVLASYYGGRGYTAHKTSKAACAASRRASQYSHEILDGDGTKYHAHGDALWVVR